MLKGLSFSFQEWTRLRSLYDQYCELRNSHWDDGWHMLMNGPHPKIPSVVLTAQAPRAIHAGRCGGLHFHAKECNITAQAESFKQHYGASTQSNVLEDSSLHQLKFKNPTNFEAAQLKCNMVFNRTFKIGFTQAPIWPPNYLKSCFHFSNPSFKHVTWGSGLFKADHAARHIIKVYQNTKYWTPQRVFLVDVCLWLIIWLLLAWLFRNYLRKLLGLL